MSSIEGNKKGVEEGEKKKEKSEEEEGKEIEEVGKEVNQNKEDRKLGGEGAGVEGKKEEGREERNKVDLEKEGNSTQEERKEERNVEEKEKADAQVTVGRQESWGRVGGTVLPLRADESKLPILPAPIIPPIPPQFILPTQPFDHNTQQYQQQIPQNQLPWHWGPDSGAGKGNMMWGDMR